MQGTDGLVMLLKILTTSTSMVDHAVESAALGLVEQRCKTFRSVPFLLLPADNRRMLHGCQLLDMGTYCIWIGAEFVSPASLYFVL